MKTLKIISVTLALFLLTGQNIKGQTISAKEDSIRLANTSLFQEYVKSNNYADAVKPWELVYEKFPASTAYIYAYGAKILAWQISEAKTQEEKKALINKLMKLYDDRIIYFGTNAKQPEGWILGMKALDYVSYHPEDELKKDAYNWLEKSITLLGEKSELAFLQQYIILSSNIYLKDKTHGAKYIQDYITVSGIIDNDLNALSENDSTERKQYELIKKNNESIFISSGAADCKTLELIYDKDLEANKTNAEWLNKTCSFFRILKCTESETYFNASVYLHKIKPTIESANGCAEMMYLKKNYSSAISFYNEAISLETKNSNKAEYQYKIAQIYYLHIKNLPKARDYANEAIVNKPNWAKPYILIAMMYAETKNVFGDDAILNATVYWAAVDKLEKAKKVDPSSAEDAQSLINTYKKYYPKKEDVFFKPELEPGKLFEIGGWINESVISR